MQSRLVSYAGKFSRLELFGRQKQFPAQILGCATTSGRTADPATHAVDPEEVSATEAIQDEKLRHRPGTAPTNKDDESYVPPKSPLKSAPKLESSGVGPRTDPITQQKRRRSVKIDDVSCAGLDGSPWPEDDRVADRKAQRAEQEADNKEYFKHHRASPLSEIKIADTRGIVSKASGGIAQSRSVGYEVGGGNVWLPEQLDTAEDSLRRAMEIFRANAARGDPDSPHGRVLREMRGEYW